MGLFDSLTSDPDQQRALMQGLLSGAFGAMAGRGSRLQAWGQGGLAGLMGYQGSLDKTAQAKQQALQNERQALQDQLLRGQLGQQQRQAQIQALPGQFYRAPSMPGVDATGGMETAMENPANQASPEGRFDMGGYQNALMGLDPVQALQLKAMTEPKKAAPIKGSPGDVFFDPASGQRLFDVPAQPKEADPNKPFMMVDGKLVPNTAYQQYAKEVARAGSSSVSYGQPIAGVDDKGNPVFFRTSKDTGAPAIVPGVRPNQKTDKDMTDAQAKANLFGTRASEADKIIASLAATGVTAPSVAQQVTRPDGIAGRVATALASPKQQQIDQAQRDFINAVLRRESGAVIAESEFQNARMQYFPQPGDSKEVIQQKARNRQIATEGILAEVPQARRGVPSSSKSADNDPLGIR